MHNYSQLKALWAITKASLQSILKNPGSLFFSLLFPLVFVMIFGAFGGGGMHKFKIAFQKNADTNNIFYQTLVKLPYIKKVNYTDTSLQRKDLERGKLTAVMQITGHNPDSLSTAGITVKLISTTASTDELLQLNPLLENMIDKLEKQFYPKHAELVHLQQSVYQVREYKQIDFVLPGQIGFSLLFSTLFGIAFTFFNMREQLVLKRFYATPVSKLNILLGIGFSRVFFQLINVLVLVLVGRFFLGFTLAHGFFTFLQMVLLSIVLLILLMGVGLIFSSIVKSDNTIPLYINVFSLPQMLLSGTFFSTTVFPKWMQNATQILPLTHFNTAIRKISFEGASLLDCLPQLGVLILWILIVYAIVIKYFKWE